MASIPFSRTIKWPSTILKKLYKVSHTVRNYEMQTLHRNLDCPEIWMSRHTSFIKKDYTVMILSFLDRYAWANSADPDQRSSLIRVYTVCHSLCIVWTHYSMVEPHSSNFRVITTNFLGVRIFRKFTVDGNGPYLNLFVE